MALVEPGYQTISEVVLLPGEQALLAPSWVPWDQRIRKGDVGPGDLLPTAPDDPRLVPGYLDSDDPAVKEVAYEFGFGRVRVLSREGRDDAAERWHDGPFGPGDAVATQAQANCVTCGFFTPLAGLLGMALGACTNEYSPADGRVVDAGYGCGAHSETVIDAPLISASTATVVDELTLEVHPRRPAAGSAATAESEVEPETGTDEVVPNAGVAQDESAPEVRADSMEPAQETSSESVSEASAEDAGTGSAEPLPELAMQPDVVVDKVLTSDGHRRDGHRSDGHRSDGHGNGAGIRIRGERSRRRSPRVGPLTGPDPFGTAALRRVVLDAWAASPARFREDANAEEALAVGGYAGRVLIELASNAADAARELGVPARIRIRLHRRRVAGRQHRPPTHRRRGRRAVVAAGLGQTRHP